MKTSRFTQNKSNTKIYMKCLIYKKNCFYNMKFMKINLNLKKPKRKLKKFYNYRKKSVKRKKTKKI